MGYRPVSSKRGTGNGLRRGNNNRLCRHPYNYNTTHNWVSQTHRGLLISLCGWGFFLTAILNFAVSWCEVWDWEIFENHLGSNQIFRGFFEISDCPRPSKFLGPRTCTSWLQKKTNPHNDKVSIVYSLINYSLIECESPMCIHCYVPRQSLNYHSNLESDWYQLGLLELPACVTTQTCHQSYLLQPSLH